MSVSDFVDSVVRDLSAVHLVAAFLVIAGLVFRVTSKRKQKRPPGPTGLPLLGNLLDFRGSTLYKKTLEWKGRFGDVIRYHIGLREWVVLGSIEAMTEAYTERGTDFASKPHVHSLYEFSQGGNNIAFAPYSEALRYRRKVLMQALRQYLTGSQNTERIHGVVLEAVAHMNTQRGPFNPHSIFSHIIFNLLHDICFGYTFPVNHPTYLRLLSFVDSKLEGIGFWEDMFPVLLHFPTKSFQTVTNNVKHIREYIIKHLQERKENADGNKAETLLDDIILAKKQIDVGEDEILKSGFTELHVINLIRDVIVGGILTSRHTLEWIFLYLAANQNIQNKIHDELDEVIGDGTPGREHRQDLVYTEAVIMEIMRMFPVIPMGLPHETLCDTKVRGYDIPAGSRVMVNQYAILHDPRHWDKPELFMPERFLEDDGKKLKTRNKSWIPFSVGPRNCIGEFLAKQNVFFSTVGLLQKLHFDLDPTGGKPNFEPELRWLTFETKPYKIVVTPRK